VAEKEQYDDFSHLRKAKAAAVIQRGRTPVLRKKRNIFWFCAIGIAVISLPYVLMDRVHLRFYHGYAEGKKLGPLMKYAYSSTDYWPRYPFIWGGWWYWWFWW
jgi:hypothetical protein